MKTSICPKCWKPQNRVHVNWGDGPHTWEWFCHHCMGLTPVSEAAQNTGMVIRTVREWRGYSRREAAQKLGINPSELSLIEMGSIVCNDPVSVLQDILGWEALS